MAIRKSTLKLYCKAFLTKWDYFWFKPDSLVTLGIVRILTGITIMATIAGVAQSFPIFLTDEGFYSSFYNQNMPQGLFHFFQNSIDNVKIYLSWVFFHAFLFTIGFFTRFQTIILFLGFSSLVSRMGFIAEGADAILTYLLFFFIFMPTGFSVSLDAYLKKKKEQEYPIWPLRFLQIFVCSIFFGAGIGKIYGSEWLDGTALYYIYRVDMYTRLPLPALFTDNLTITALSGYLVVILEVLVPILIWIKKMRLYALWCAIIIHLAIDYILPLYMFEFVMIAVWISFFDSKAFESLENKYLKLKT